MDHICYIDTSNSEYLRIRQKVVNLLIRGSIKKKIPYQKIFTGDLIYFALKSRRNLLLSRCIVKRVIDSQKLDKSQSIDFIKKYQKWLMLSPTEFKKYSNKNYLTIVEIEGFQEFDPFVFNPRYYEEYNDWTLAGKIKEDYYVLQQFNHVHQQM